MKKTFLKSDWQKMAIHSAPTATAPQIRLDSEGNKWAWLSSGKRVEALKLP